MNEELIDYMMYKLTELQIKEHHQNIENGKKRYVLKEQAYKDLIQLLKTMKREVL